MNVKGCDVGVLNGFVRFEKGASVGCFEYGNELSSSKRVENLLIS